MGGCESAVKYRRLRRSWTRGRAQAGRQAGQAVAIGIPTHACLLACQTLNVRLCLQIEGEGPPNDERDDNHGERETTRQD